MPTRCSDKHCPSERHPLGEDPSTAREVKVHNPIRPPYNNILWPDAIFSQSGLLTLRSVVGRCRALVRSGWVPRFGWTLQQRRKTHRPKAPSSSPPQVGKLLLRQVQLLFFLLGWMLYPLQQRITPNPSVFVLLRASRGVDIYDNGAWHSVLWGSRFYGRCRRHPSRQITVKWRSLKSLCLDGVIERQ